MLLSIPQILFAQPDTLWTRTFGGDQFDGGYCVQETSDSGYIIVGSTSLFSASPDTNDIWLIKTDKNGNTLWTKTYGDTDVESGRFVQETQDGGFIITGEKTGLETNVYLVRTNSIGDTLWTRIYVGDVGKCVQETNDGGFIIIDRDMQLIKTDSLGNLLWAKTYGKVLDKAGSSVQQIFDGGFILTGFTSEDAQGYYDIWLVKTNANGDSLWAKTYGGTGWDSGRFGCQTSDSGFIVVGYTDSYGAGEDDVWIVKVDKNGTKLWDTTFGGMGYDSGSFVQETSDEGFIITGRTDSYGVGGFDMWVIRTDKNGKKLWDTTFGGTAMSYERGHCIRQTSDGGFIVLGEKEQNIWLIRLETEESVEEVNSQLYSYQLYQNIPNPFNQKTIIKYKLSNEKNVLNSYSKLEIYNISGRFVRTLELSHNAQLLVNEVIWDGSNNKGEKVRNGVYFYRLETDGYVLTKKMYLIR